MPAAQPLSATPALEMSDVAVGSLHAPSAILIQHLNWTVQVGDYWVVGGWPASGKSDLLATAAGLIRPPHGRVRLFGQDLTELHEEERLQVQLRVGIVFGYGGRLFNHLTVAENLSLPLCYHQNCAPTSTQQRVQAVLETMELAGIAQSTPALLNRNQRQRVALARALVLSPELLLLDNPLAGIDPRETRWWLEFLDQLLNTHPLMEGRRLTLIVSTDDLLPWGERARQFALITKEGFVTLGSRTDLVRSDNPAWRELLPAEWLST